MVQIMMQWYTRCYRDGEEVNLKLNKEKCHFRCTSIPFFWGSDIKKRSATRPTKIKSHHRHASAQQQDRAPSLPWYINYLGKFSPGTTDVCDPLCKLTLSKVTLTWNILYQLLFNKTKLLIKSDMCMKFYDDIKPLYLEIDASGVGLGAALLQTSEGTTCQKDTVPDNTILCPIAFAS